MAKITPKERRDLHELLDTCIDLSSDKFGIAFDFSNLGNTPKPYFCAHVYTNGRLGFDTNEDAVYPCGMWPQLDRAKEANEKIKKLYTQKFGKIENYLQEPNTNIIRPRAFN